MLFLTWRVETSTLAAVNLDSLAPNKEVILPDAGSAQIEQTGESLDGGKGIETTDVEKLPTPPVSPKGKSSDWVVPHTGLTPPPLSTVPSSSKPTPLTDCESVERAILGVGDKTNDELDSLVTRLSLTRQEVSKLKQTLAIQREQASKDRALLEAQLSQTRKYDDVTLSKAACAKHLEKELEDLRAGYGSLESQKSEMEKSLNATIEYQAGVISAKDDAVKAANSHNLLKSHEISAMQKNWVEVFENFNNSDELQKLLRGHIGLITQESQVKTPRL